MSAANVSSSGGEYNVNDDAIHQDAEIKCLELVNTQATHKIIAEHADKLFKRLGADDFSKLISELLKGEYRYIKSFTADAEVESSLATLEARAGCCKKPTPYTRLDYEGPSGAVIKYRNLVMGMCLDYVWERNDKAVSLSRTETSAANVIKVGSKVRILEASNGGYTNDIGKILKVDALRTDKLTPFWVVNGNFYFDEKLELVEEEIVKNPCSEIPEPIHHLDRAIAEQNAYYNFRNLIIKPTTKETAMSIKIETKTFLNGSDIKGFSDTDLFLKLSEAEKEIDKLKDIKTKSKKVADRIADLEQGCLDLAAAIDAR